MLPAEAPAKHLYVCGASGSGKSKLLEHLIRHDIVGWRGQGRGLVLLDPHGSLYGALMGWLAAHPHLLEGDHPRPVVPLNFGSPAGGVVPCYDPLRDHGGATATSVVVEGLIQAIAHVWGVGETTQTPLFRRWVYNVLLPLYVNGCPLTDAVRLVRQPLFRRALLRRVQDGGLLCDWEISEGLQPKCSSRRCRAR